MAWRAGIGLTAAVASLLALGASAGDARQASSPVVRCGDVIGQQASGSLGGSRVVLGAVSVPPARIQRAAASGTAPWTHFSKWGIAIHRGTAAEVSVPRAWRGRVAITWGASTPTVSTLRFAACRLPGSQTRPWSAYPGGFYIDTATACVPLTIAVGGRARTVRFGIGKSCAR